MGCKLLLIVFRRDWIKFEQCPALGKKRDKGRNQSCTKVRENALGIYL